MALVCHKMYIMTGDGKSVSKAEWKNDHWEEHADCPRTTIERGLVSSETYFKYIDKIAAHFPDEEILVFFTHSGARNNNKKYKFPTEFDKANHALVRKHSNVRILAVMRKKGPHFKLMLEKLGFGGLP
jgi:hypothetical protein